MAVQFGKLCGDARSSDDLLRERKAHRQFDHAAKYVSILGGSQQKPGNDRIGW